MPRHLRRISLALSAGYCFSFSPGLSKILPFHVLIKKADDVRDYPRRKLAFYICRFLFGLSKDISCICTKDLEQDFSGLRVLFFDAVESRVNRDQGFISTVWSVEILIKSLMKKARKFNILGLMHDALEVFC